MWSGSGSNTGQGGVLQNVLLLLILLFLIFTFISIGVMIIFSTVMVIIFVNIVCLPFFFVIHHNIIIITIDICSFFYSLFAHLVNFITYIPQVGGGQ